MSGRIRPLIINRYNEVEGGFTPTFKVWSDHVNGHLQRMGRTHGVETESGVALDTDENFVVLEKQPGPMFFRRPYRKVVR